MADKNENLIDFGDEPAAEQEPGQSPSHAAEEPAMQVNPLLELENAPVGTAGGDAPAVEEDAKASGEGPDETEAEGADLSGVAAGQLPDPHEVHETGMEAPQAVESSEPQPQQLEQPPVEQQQLTHPTAEEELPFDPLRAAAREQPPAPAQQAEQTAQPIHDDKSAPQGVVDQLTVRRYLDGTVVPVLRGAMRELCLKRPADPYQFLADYILEHRPK